MSSADAAGASLTGFWCEAYRLRLLRGLEDLAAVSGFQLVAGVDEAGRGCLAGPVVAAAVVMDPRQLVVGVDDSKRLLPEQRTRLAACIRRAALACAWVAVPADIVDRINVLEATRVAMLGALDRLELPPELVLVDAVPLRWRAPCVPLVRGDRTSYAVACASIIAKTERDRLMMEYDQRYPGYGFAEHKGYAAVRHRQAIEELGPTPIHRLTFRSVLPRLDDIERPGTASARGAA
jgi:ribonuclease HII